MSHTLQLMALNQFSQTRKLMALNLAYQEMIGEMRPHNRSVSWELFKNEENELFFLTAKTRTGTWKSAGFKGFMLYDEGVLRFSSFGYINLPLSLYLCDSDRTDITNLTTKLDTSKLVIAQSLQEFVRRNANSLLDSARILENLEKFIATLK